MNYDGKHIPTKMISPDTNFLWLRQAHKQAKSTNASGDWEFIRKLRRFLDRSHLMAVGDNLMTRNSKPFWQFIESLRHSSTGASLLNTINGIVTSATVPLIKQMPLIINSSQSSLKRIVVN